MTTMNEERAAIEAAYAGVAEGGWDSVKDMGIKMFQAGASWQRAQAVAVPEVSSMALRAALLGIASVNPAERGIEWAKSYASDGLKGAGSELYARWLIRSKRPRRCGLRMRGCAKAGPMIRRRWAALPICASSATSWRGCC